MVLYDIWDYLETQPIEIEKKNNMMLALREADKALKFKSVYEEDKAWRKKHDNG